jgi:hypothetical protein
MLSTIDASVRYFCEDILGLVIKDGSLQPKEFFGASIPLTHNNSEAHYYLFFEPPVLDAFGDVLLGEPVLDEADRDDLCKEVANQIIGHAKVSLETNLPNDEFRLGTPEFLGQIPSPSPVKLEGFLLYELQSGRFLVGKGI